MARSEVSGERLSVPKRIVFATIMAALVAGVTEFAAIALAYRIATKNVVDFRPPFLPSSLHAPPRRNDAVPGYQATYDPDLGWVNKRGLKFNGDSHEYTYDDQGARESSRPFTTTRISTYGDSFTHGDLVGPDETWSQGLANRFQTNVVNFGVGGYGTDQAVLRIEKNCRAGRRTDVVILGICPENVNRILGNLRAFYTNVVCVPCATNGPKPMFTKTATGFELLGLHPEPLAAFDLSLNEARRHDFWYRGFSFPYALSLLRWYSRAREQVRDCGPRCQGRWDLPLARETMHLVLVRFVQLSREYGFHGVVAFIPTWSDVAAASPGYRPFLQDVEGKPELTGLTFVEVAGEHFKPAYEQYVASDGLHPGVEGHRLIAEALAPAIAPILQPRPLGSQPLP